MLYPIEPQARKTKNPALTAWRELVSHKILLNLSAHATAEASVPKDSPSKVHDALSIAKQVLFAKGPYGILKTRWADLEPMPLYPAFRGEES